MSDETFTPDLSLAETRELAEYMKSELAWTARNLREATIPLDGALRTLHDDSHGRQTALRTRVRNIQRNAQAALDEVLVLQARFVELLDHDDEPLSAPLLKSPYSDDIPF